MTQIRKYLDGLSYVDCGSTFVGAGCPSDHGMFDLPGCSNRNGTANDCFYCWHQEFSGWNENAFSVEVGAKYRHRKGGVYTIVGICTHTETGDLLVCYVGSDGKTWARPAQMFCDGSFERIEEKK